MEVALHFVITKVDGTQVTQDFKCSSEAAEQIMQQAFAQFSQIGMMKKEGNHFTLLPSSQIKLVEIDLPTLVIADDGDVKQVAKASEGLKRIITI